MPLAGCDAELLPPKKDGDEHRLVIGSLDNKQKLVLRGNEISTRHLLAAGEGSHQHPVRTASVNRSC